MALDGIPEPDPAFREVLAVLVWDHGDVPLDLQRDIEVLVVRGIGTANPDLLDRFHAWLGQDRLVAILDRVAEQIPWLGMTMAVYRFDLPRVLIGRSHRQATEWLGQDDEHAGIAFLQAGWTAT